MSTKKTRTLSSLPAARHANLCVEALEQRVMYSADVLGTVEIERYFDSALASDDQSLENLLPAPASTLSGSGNSLSLIAASPITHK